MKLTKKVLVYALFYCLSCSMRNKILTACLLLAIVSCTQQSTTPEQRAKYEKCRAMTAKFYKANPVTGDDSLKAIRQDIIVLSLDELVKKHQMKKEDIDDFISSVCISAELNNTFNSL